MVVVVVVVEAMVRNPRGYLLGNIVGLCEGKTASRTLQPASEQNSLYCLTLVKPVKQQTNGTCGLDVRQM